MKTASRTTAVTLAVFCMMAAGVNFVNAQTSVKPPNTQQSASRATPTSPNLATYQATGVKTAAKIQASSTDNQAMVKAVRTKNIDAASALLLKNGFTSAQLQGAKIEFADNTGGTAGKFKITIRVDCCPLVITITISL